MHTTQQTAGRYGAFVLGRTALFALTMTMEAIFGAASAERLEYVESTGSQWLDTGVVPNHKTRLTAAFQFTEMPSQAIAASWASSASQEAFKFGIRDGKFMVNVSITNIYVFVGTPNKDIHTVDLRSGEQRFDGVVRASNPIGDTATSKQTIYLFAEHGEWSTTPVNHAKVRFYACRIWDGEDLVRDYIPWRDEQSGKAGLFNQVNSEFFASKSSDTFVAGPAVKILDWVESTGQERISTFVVPRSTTRLWVDFQYTAPVTEQYNGWGSSGNAEAFEFGVRNGKFAYCVSSNTQYTITDVPFDLERHTFDLAPGSQQFDCVEYSQNVIGDTAADWQMINLFAQHAEWVPSTSHCRSFARMRLYGCKIWDGDSLLHDYLPCERNGTIGLLDTAGGGFIRSRTGCDLKHPISNDVNLTPLSYIETDGRQYLETDIIPSSATRVCMDTAFLSTTNQFSGWGSEGSQEAFEFGIRNGRLAWSVSSNTKYVEAVPCDQRRHRFDLRNGSQKLDDVEYSTTTIGDTAGVGQTLLLFARRGEWNAWTKESIDAGSLQPDLFCSMRFYGCRIWQGDTLVRDYVPCLRNGETGIFDQVNRVFHNGITEHPFLAGPELRPGLTIVVQ